VSECCLLAIGVSSTSLAMLLTVLLLLLLGDMATPRSILMVICLMALAVPLVSVAATSQLVVKTGEQSIVAAAVGGDTQ